MDTIPMPAEHILDKLIGCCRLSPFKCRACRAKFYRSSSSVPKRPVPVRSMDAEPAADVAVCQRDPADTLRRVDRIILVAEGTRLRKG